MKIHPTAVVEEGARLDSDCIVHPYAVIRAGCELGRGVVVHPFAVLGGEPQDLSWQPSTPSGVRIGARTVIREHVTVNRATKAGEYTEVGADCFLMAGCHVAHDCRVGERVVLANAVLLAGHVRIGARAFLGGGAIVHQFCRIGEGAMLGGAGRVSLDVAPFTLAVERNTSVGLNVVGLRRRGVGRQAMDELKRAFRAVNVPAGNPRVLAEDCLLSGQFQTEEAKRFLEFFREGRRGFVRCRSMSEEPAQD